MKSKKLKKIISMAIVGATVSTITPTSAYATWINDSQNHWSWVEDGSNATGWKEIDGTWYNFDSDGNMKTGWIKTLDSKWYYMSDDGSMKTGWLQDTNKKWYYLATDGSMKTGWIKDIDGKWYFSDISGAMQTGVVKVQGKVYVFEASGAMATGSTIIGGETYKIDANGAIIGDKLPNIDKTFTSEGIVSANAEMEGTKGEAVINTSQSSDNSSSSSDSNSSSSGGGSSSSGSKSSNSTSSSTNSGTSSTSGTTTNVVTSSTSTSSTVANTTDNSISTNTDTSKTADTTQSSTNTNSSVDNNASQSDSVTNLKNAVAAVKNAKDTAAMEKAITDNKDILGLRLSQYNLLNDKTPVYQALIGKDFSDNTGSDTEVSLFFEKLNIEIAFDNQVYTQYIKETGSSNSSMGGSGTGEVSAKATWIASAVNAEDETEFEKVLEEKSGSWGLDLTEYNALKDKDAVRKAVIEKLSGSLEEGLSSTSSTYYLVINLNSQIKQIFDDAVSAEKLTEENATTTTTDGALTVTSGSTDTDKTSDETQASKDTDSSTEKLAEESTSLPTTTTTTESAVTVTSGSTNSDTSKTSEATQSSTDTNSSDESSSKNDTNNTGSSSEESASLPTTTTTTESSVTVTSGSTNSDTDETQAATDTDLSDTDSATDLKSAVAAVKNAKDTAAMEKAITDNKDILELRLSQYNLLNDKTPVYQALIGEDFSDNTGSNSEVSLFFEKLNIEMAFDNEVYTQYIKETGSSNTSMGGTGTGEVSAKATWIASVVNAEDETEFEKVLEEKSGSWGLDLTEYNALKDKDAVRKAVIEKLSDSLEEGLSSTSSTYYVVISLNSQMKQIFDDAVSAEKSVEKI